MANESYKLRGTKQPIAFGGEKLEGYKLTLRKTS